ncbi:MAG TPA: hypothetical protein VFS00_32535, partial [Polyangiaceae bacterium]|nr:hypothetical protein [Polyangiaceae bacterium]
MKRFVILCFSFREQDFYDDDGFDKERYERHAREAEWFESSRGRAKLDPELSSVDELAAAFRAVAGGAGGRPEDIIAALFEKLRAA